METIFKHFYPAAVDRYNETGSIKQVCEEEGGGDKEGGSLALASGLQVFTKFNPMLGMPTLPPSSPPVVLNASRLSLSLSSLSFSQPRASTRRCRRAANR